MKTETTIIESVVKGATWDDFDNDIEVLHDDIRDAFAEAHYDTDRTATWEWTDRAARYLDQVGR